MEGIGGCFVLNISNRVKIMRKRNKNGCPCLQKRAHDLEREKGKKRGFKRGKEGITEGLDKTSGDKIREKKQGKTKGGPVTHCTNGKREEAVSRGKGTKSGIVLEDEEENGQVSPAPARVDPHIGILSYHYYFIYIHVEDRKRARFSRHTTRGWYFIRF